MLAVSLGTTGCGPKSDTHDATPAAASTAVAGSPAGKARPPNIVLITVESLRTDHVGAYGGKSHSRPDVPLTPALDALAKEGVVYEDAHSVTSWTLASHASIFTGLYPSAHQTKLAQDRLDDSYNTLAERLAAQGYDTAGVVSGPYLRKAHNLSQGFAQYHDEIASATHVQSHGDVTNPRMLETIRQVVDHERDRNRPFFLFAYFWDPHYDYIPPDPYATMFQGPDCQPIDIHRFETSLAINPNISPEQLAYVFSQYEGEIRWTDEHLGRFFQFLRDKGLWDDTVIIVTADHGDEFFDHGEKGHLNNIYAETVHVPLIVKYARGGRTGRDGRLVSLVDVLPTVLELAGAPSAGPLDGQSLLLTKPPEDRAIFYELLSVWRAPPRTWKGVRQGGHKLVVSPELGRRELYDVLADPTEKVDLAQTSESLVQQLEATLGRWQGEAQRTAALFKKGGTAPLTPQETERLRSLGYIQ